VFCPDTDTDNRNQRLAQGLFEELSRRLKEADVALLDDSQAARDAGGFLAQVCLLSEREALLGVMRAGDAISLAPGGRMRSHVSGEAPARSAMKLAEAFTWFGQGPEPGDVCVDLGAAPGGWTHVLSQRRAHVVAIDPGALRPQVLRHGVEHLRMSAFDFEPEVPADWLFCDMAWRPLEVAALLAKWGRRHWARFLIANIKLPMNKRAAMVQRVLEILRTGGWTALKARQLYHDRDEVTIAGWRGFGGDARPPAKKREPMPATKPKTGGERGGRPQGSGGGPRRQNYGKGRR
jgi:23S rRNA (cytidine2498-2'-O)-methyltransferase